MTISGVRHGVRIFIPKKLKRFAKQRARLKLADAILVSPPGSGRTWLAAMLSHYYHLTRGAPADLLIKQARFYAGLPDVRRYFLAHPSQIWGERAAADAAKLHARKATLFLIRDPRDIAVTMHWHRWMRGGASSNCGSAPGRNARRLRFDDLAGAVVGVIRRLHQIEAVAVELPDHLLLTYEGLRAAPEVNVSALIDAVERSVDRAAVAEAVAFCSFDRMKCLEREGFFQARALQPGAADEPESFKVRRGEVGGYRRYLSEAEAAMVDKLVAERLSVSLRDLIAAAAPPTTLDAGSGPLHARRRLR